MAILKHTAKKIFREQVHLLFANSMVPIFLSVLAAVLLCWALQSVISHNVLTLWIAVFCIISAMRIALLVLFKREAIRFRTEGTLVLVLPDRHLCNSWGVGIGSHLFVS